ncbi:MAG TPA: putative lipoprotein [Myxococcota bacterium]|nr:putative lipoprotein [Myxococcota bacterium]
MNSRRALLAAALIATLPAFGCTAISAIVEIPSDISAGSSRSIAGSFDAISTSSSSGGDASTPNKTSYQRDLRQYAALFVKGSGTSEEFLRGVARIAEDHGITHWESDAMTPRAIGQGLRDAKLSEADMDAFVDSVGRDKPAAQLALEGYRQPGG